MAHDDPPAGDDRPADLLPFLGRMADTFLETVDDGPGTLFYVAPDTAGCDVGLRQLEAPPAEALLGFVAPDDWSAMGVAAGGWARSLDGAGGGSRTRAAVVTIVHRSGQVVGRVKVGDRVITEPPAYGLTLDGLQRALGLPTAPPLEPTGVLFAATWLENIVAACVEGRRRLTWAEAQALHPGLQLLASAVPRDDDEIETLAAVDVIKAARTIERVCDWETLRWMVVEGRLRERNLSPAEAAWFDAGSFSRWALTWRAGLDDLVQEVKRASGSGVGRRCAAVLHRLGVLSPAAA